MTARTVTPIEQHVHSFQEMIPLIAIISIVSVHWGQFLASFGFGEEPARFDLVWKKQPLLFAYIVTIMAIVVLFEFLPYLEELARGLRANLGKLVPPQDQISEPFITTAALTRRLAIAPNGGLAQRRRRKSCGHDGQRKSVAHMPTAPTTADRVPCSVISGDRNGQVSN